MKKIVLFFFAAFFLFQNSSAQSYDVQPVPYLPYSFTQGDTLILSDDQYSGVISLGFDFCFFGLTYNEILISSNSYITFNTASAGGYSPWSIPGPIPDSTQPELLNTIMFPWQDLLPPSGGAIYYALYGQAPCRKFVISYTSIAMFSCTTLNFSNQVVLYESSNVIETYIQSKPLCSAWNGGQAIHGLQNADGSEAVIIPGRNAPEQWEAYSDAYRFIPLTCGVDTNSCSFLIDTVEHAFIRGKVFIDSIANCSYDLGEYKITNEIVSLSPSGFQTFINSSGDYSFYVLDTGNYQVNFNGPPFLQVTCTQGIVNIPFFNDTGIVDLPIESLNCAAVLNELDILLVRPCSTSTVYISLENQGSIHSGTIYVSVLLPPGLTVVSATWPYTTSGDTLIFMLPDGLFPSEDTFISILADASCDLVIGDVICAQSWIDFENPACTVLTLTDGVGCATVVNSYDPNDKRFSYANHLSTDGYFVLDTITENDSLVYMIRFQNTGNATAYDVRIMDEFPEELDLTTFHMLAASHAYQLSIADRTITWTFDNIMLPDDGSDPVNSIGFVKFKIRQTGNTLPLNEINNHASIFFDFNPPIITNTAICVYKEEVTNSINSLQNDLFSLYPNPSTGQITVVGNIRTGYSLQLFDITGKQLKSYLLNGTNSVIDMSTITDGFYLYRVLDEKQDPVGNGKLQIIR